jgi:hypothetical protein
MIDLNICKAPVNEHLPETGAIQIRYIHSFIHYSKQYTNQNSSTVTWRPSLGEFGVDQMILS